MPRGELGSDPNESFGQRMFRARVELSARLGEKVPQDGFGLLVARRLGREKPITAATVSRWEAGEGVPDLATIQAAAELSGVDPGWLAFGSRSQAPAPGPIAIPPMVDGSNVDEVIRQSNLRLMHTLLEGDVQVERIVKQRRARTARWYKQFKAAKALPEGDAKKAELERLHRELLEDDARSLGERSPSSE
jgi:transcriptional regulator with XRE-family HTH domain